MTAAIQRLFFRLIIPVYPDAGEQEPGRYSPAWIEDKEVDHVIR